MRAWILATVAVSAFGCANVAHAQSAPKLFFEGDLERGNQAGTPPACVLNSQFKHLDKVVFRVRVLDASGKPLDDKGLKSLVVELPDGKKLDARFGAHPPKEGTDHFWTAAWIVPAEYPNGTVSYKITATDLEGHSQSWEPFKVSTSQLMVLAGDIEIKK